MHSCHVLHRIEVETRDPRLEQLTEAEIAAVIEAQTNGYHEQMRRCALGIMNTGSVSDSTAELLHHYPNFDVGLRKSRQGIAFIFENAPIGAFLEQPNGSYVMIEAIREHMCAAVRDLVYQATQIGTPVTSEEITGAVYKILRHADFFDIAARSGDTPLSMNRAFVWGGHSIDPAEYKYTKEVGRAMARALFELITGCGPGAMRGPFSGATLAYKERRIEGAKMIGLTCPSIITSEPPNAFIDPLIILQNIEQRLEAFIRGSNGGIVVPGGAGTAEEIMTMLSILLHERNANLHYPLLFTSSAASAGYFDAIDAFLRKTLGEDVQDKYRIIIDDPEEVARHMAQQAKKNLLLRDALDESYTWYSKLHIPPETQEPFAVSHDTVEHLNLSRNQAPYKLAAQLRRLFSAIVSGNVTDAGIRMVKDHGPFVVHGDADILAELDTLLKRFVAERRMKLKGEYVPCYRLAS